MRTDPIHIPALRERPGDIELLVQTLLPRFTTLHSKRLSSLTERALQALCSYHWPGNVRELENLLERGVILASQGEAIEVEHLFSNQPGHRLQPPSTGIDHHGQLTRLLSPDDASLCERLLGRGLSLDQIEHQLLEFAVHRAKGNLTAAARLLGITRPQLAYRLRRKNDPDPRPHA